MYNRSLACARDELAHRRARGRACRARVHRGTAELTMGATRATDATAVVEVQDLHKVYEQDGLHVPVLRGVSLRIDRGEVVALMGPSGSGKSTLLNILGCLDRPSRGHYLLGGRDVSTLDRVEQAWVRL